MYEKAKQIVKRWCMEILKGNQYDADTIRRKQVQSLYAYLTNVKEIIQGIHYEISFFSHGHILELIVYVFL
jgi:hypothetical protein